MIPTIEQMRDALKNVELWRGKNPTWKGWDVIRTILQNAINPWQPIETAPINNTWYLGLIEGIPYKVESFMNGDTVNYHWCMHTNMASGQVLQIEKDDNGVEKRIQIKESEEPRYEPQIIAYKKGMNHIPTHWMPLPPPPKGAGE